MRTSKCFLALALFTLLIAMEGSTSAQTLTVLHTFTGGGDGARPYVGVTLDQAGSVYGTTTAGGAPGSCGGYGCGVVFKLTHKNNTWVETPLYSFTGGSDGAVPLARVVFGANGTLYGSTYIGGNSPYPFGAGVIFNLRPPSRISSRVLTPWNETVLFTFGNTNDGNNPTGDLTFDAAGNIYGTTQTGGFECEDTVYCGTIYELTRNGSTWTESLLYIFTNGNIALPYSGVIFDQAGNLYGTTTNGAGAVFQLTQSGSSWTLNDLHGFGNPGDGAMAVGGLIFDPAGNLYGTTQAGGSNNTGTVYKLAPSGGGWTESVIYSLPANSDDGPFSGLTRDAAGNLYGTTCGGGSHLSGSLFKLIPSGGGWVGTTLYSFTGGSDGYCPMSGLVVDGNGNLYGTTIGGGNNQNDGVVFEFTP
jgi:uncharacterized repeat protein (TIGR03803 family)